MKYVYYDADLFNSKTKKWITCKICNFNAKMENIWRESDRTFHYTDSQWPILCNKCIEYLEKNDADFACGLGTYAK